MATGETTNPIMTHQAELAPGGTHDTHLYDPNATPGEAPVLAVYETPALATAARDSLLQAGLPAADIVLVLPDAAAPLPAPGLLDSIKQAVMPEYLSDPHSEALRRGHPVLAVRPGQTGRHAVVAALARTSPLDFDVRLEEWRAAGWNSLAQQQAQAPGVVTAAPGVAPVTQTAAAATAGPTGRATDVVQTATVPGTSGRAAEAGKA